MVKVKAVEESDQGSEGTIERKSRFTSNITAPTNQSNMFPIPPPRPLSTGPSCIATPTLTDADPSQQRLLYFPGNLIMPIRIPDDGDDWTRVLPQLPNYCTHNSSEDESTDGDLRKIPIQSLPPPPPRTPSRWDMVMPNKDQSRSQRYASPLKRISKCSPTTAISNTSNCTDARMKRNTAKPLSFLKSRWSSEEEDDNTDTTNTPAIVSPETRHKKRRSQTMPMERPVRRESGSGRFRAPRQIPTTTTDIDTFLTTTIPVHHSQQKQQQEIQAAIMLNSLSIPERRRSFDSIPILPQRRKSNTCLKAEDTHSASSSCSM